MYRRGRRRPIQRTLLQQQYAARSAAAAASCPGQIICKDGRCVDRILDCYDEMSAAPNPSFCLPGQPCERTRHPVEPPPPPPPTPKRTIPNCPPGMYWNGSRCAHARRSQASIFPGWKDCPADQTEVVTTMTKRGAVVTGTRERLCRAGDSFPSSWRNENCCRPQSLPGEKLQLG
jgi:hypothetical protein